MIILWFNYQVYNLIKESYTSSGNEDFFPKLVVTGNITSLLIGFTTILFGVLAVRKKLRFGYLGLILGLIILLLVFFPLYPLLFVDSAYDINFK